MHLLRREDGEALAAVAVALEDLGAGLAIDTDGAHHVLGLVIGAHVVVLAGARGVERRAVVLGALLVALKA